MKAVNKQDLIRTQQELSELIGCSGREQSVRSYIHNSIAPYVDTLQEDAAGNLIAVKYGRNEKNDVILLDAHMDEVGFMVNHLEGDGLFRVSALGGIDPSLLPGAMVQFHATSGNRNTDRVTGVFGSIPPHVKNSLGTNGGPLKTEALTIDVGAASEFELRELGIDIGSTGTFFTPFQQLGEDSLMGKAFDNRSGCNLLLQTAYRITEEPIDTTVVFLFSTAEEHKQLGAGSIQLPLKPAAALVLENTTATDTAGTPAHFRVAELGKGPALTLADTKYVVPERIVNSLKACAERHAIPWQYKKPVYGGTNAATISTGRAGIPTGIVSVPCRYIHSPAGVLRISDLEHTANLLYYYLHDFAQEFA